MSEIFSRGYKPLRDRIKENPIHLMSCFNCNYYFQASGDKEEVCQNPNVIEFDMRVDGNNIYCNQWEQTSRKEDSLFIKKLGRSILD